MKLFVAAALSFAAFLAAWWITGRVRQYAVARRVLDVPNARSSHSVATPRGGGMAIVATTVAALLVLGALDMLAWRSVAGLGGGGLLVAVIGFIDDHGHLRRRWRLLAHFAAAGSVLWGFGGLPAVPVFGTTHQFGWAGHAIAAVYLVWLLNLTNFMDGIDGIAGTEAITVALSGAFLLASVAPEYAGWMAPTVLAAATMGFLAWNWPPAKIFMGDAGSGFLGLMLGGLSIQAAWVAPPLLWSWIVLLGVFVVDATVTLLRRVLRGERFYEPHRTHAYQHAAQRLHGHRPVTLAVAGLNLLWLTPIALLVARGVVDGVPAVAAAYIPLVGLAIWLHAGLPSQFPVRNVARP